MNFPFSFIMFSERGHAAFVSEHIDERCLYVRSIGGVNSIESFSLCSILFNFSGSIIMVIGKSIFKSFDSGASIIVDSKVIVVAATVAFVFVVAGAASIGVGIGSSALFVNPT